MTLTLTSAAFFHQDEIPSLYSCDGQDISPPLSWTGAPPGTKSMALILSTIPMRPIRPHHK